MKEQESVLPIRSEAEYEAALAEVERHEHSIPPAGTKRGDRLDLLVAVIEQWEARIWRRLAPDPVKAIQLRMDAWGYSQADLGRLLGSRSRASEILNRKRRLTVPQIHLLASEWEIPAEYLVKPYRLDHEEVEVGDRGW